MRARYFIIRLFPNCRTRIAVVLRQQFEVQHVDGAVVVQVCGGGRGSVVTHANGQRVELIDHVVAVDVASQQCDGRFRGCVSRQDVGGTLRGEEAAGSGNHNVIARRRNQAKRSIGVGIDRGDRHITGEQGHDYLFARDDLPRERAIRGSGGRG